MNVASLELCRELYELSRWEANFIYYQERYFGEKTGKFTVYRDGERYGDYNADFNPKMDIPAYDLGYLLRRLPPDSGVYRESSGEYWAHSQENLGFRADTPENATCKLLIELWKLGVLK